LSEKNIIAKAVRGRRLRVDFLFGSFVESQYRNKNWAELFFESEESIYEQISILVVQQKNICIGNGAISDI